MFTALSLPDLDALDHAALKALLLSQQQKHLEQQNFYRAEREKYAATLSSRAGEIERLVLLVEKLKHMLFGTRSEKILGQIEQLELQLEELHAASAVEELKAVTPAERPPGRGPYSAAKWGVEGFSEVLSREVAPLGIKVTIVEPGGFRTDFAGRSTELSEGHPAYDSTVGATARFQRNYNGKQPGDPKKAAQAILHLTQEQNPPLRLLLGSDAYAAVKKNDLARLDQARIWKKLSISTDFETK